MSGLAGLLGCALLVFAALIVLIVLLLRAGIHRMIVSKHEALQHIHEHGRIPDAWLAHDDARRGRRPIAGGTEAVAPGDRSELRRRRRVLARLNALERYVRKTRLVGDNDVRNRLLDDLNRLRREWDAPE